MLLSSSVIIGIAGRIASGKSTFTRTLGRHLIGAGIPTVIHSYDRIRAELLEVDQDPQSRSIREELATAIGCTLAPQEPYLSRRAIAEKTATSAEHQTLHDGIVEPAVRERIATRMLRFSPTFTVQIVEWAALIERQAWEFARDGLILLSCTAATQRQRLCGRDLSEAILSYRINNQPSEADLLRLISRAHTDNLLTTSWRISTDAY